MRKSGKSTKNMKDLRPKKKTAQAVRGGGVGDAVNRKLETVTATRDKIKGGLKPPRH